MPSEGARNEKRYYDFVEQYMRERVRTPGGRDRGWQPILLTLGGRISLLVWEIPADQEEPWRRLLQELSGPRYEEYAESRRRLGASAEYVWLAPKPSGGGVAVVCVETENLERPWRELAASETPFDSWYANEMRTIFGFDFAHLARRAVGGTPLLAWREAPSEGEQKPLEGS